MLVNFFIVEITIALVLIALFLSRGNGRETPVFRASIPLWILPAIVCLVGQIEIVLLRRTRVFYLVTLVETLILTAIPAERHVKKLW